MRGLWGREKERGGEAFRLILKYGGVSSTPCTPFGRAADFAGSFILLVSIIEKVTAPLATRTLVNYFLATAAVTVAVAAAVAQASA